MLLRSDICIILIRVGVSLPASNNPYSRTLLGQCACKVFIQAYLIVISSLFRETETGEGIRLDDGREYSFIYARESCAA